MLKRLKLFLCTFLLLCFSAIANAAVQPIQITFWHSMAGHLGQVVNQIVDQFNHSQTQYKIKAIYKGTYPETLTSTVAAFRAGQQPDMVQVFEVGTATMSIPQGAIVPVYKIFKLAGIKLNANQLLPAIHSYYSDQHGRLLAMPFNSSSAVLYYNKDAFAKAGITTPPKTWPELKKDSLRLLAAGHACGFTSTWPSWIQLETFSAWHNLPFATKNNGFSGADAQMKFNNPVVIHHVASLQKWQQQNVFRYGGRGDNASSLFTSGECQMMFQSSGSLRTLQGLVNFKLGVAPLPYWPNVKGAPQNTIIGGGAIWVMSGHKPQVYRGIAKFFAFFMTPKMQALWQRETGYVPITLAGYQLNKQQQFYKKHPGAEVAIKELSHKAPTNNSKGLRLGNYMQIRDVNAQELEAAWSGLKTAKQAIDDAVRRDNRLLKAFQQDVVDQ